MKQYWTSVTYSLLLSITHNYSFLFFYFFLYPQKGDVMEAVAVFAYADIENKHNS